MPGAPIEDTEPLPAFATLITLTATAAVLPHRPALGGAARAARLLFRPAHHRAVRRRVRPGQAQPTPPPAPSSWRCRSARPFIVYALIINLMVGIANKLTPQIPVYFISAARGPRRRLLPALLHDRRVAAPLHDGLHGLAGEGVRGDERASPQDPPHPRRAAAALPHRGMEARRSRAHAASGWRPPSRSVIRALNEDDALQGLFIDAMARRLRSLGEEASRVGQEQAMPSRARLLEHGARKVCAERLARAARPRRSRGRPTRRSFSTSSSASSARPHKPPARLPGDSDSVTPGSAPGSTIPLAPAPAVGWIPGTSPGMTARPWPSPLLPISSLAWRLPRSPTNIAPRSRSCSA